MNNFKLKKIEKLLGADKTQRKRYGLIIVEFEKGKFRLSSLYDEILKKRIKINTEKIYLSVDEIHSEFNIKKDEILLTLRIKDPW